MATVYLILKILVGLVLVAYLGICGYLYLNQTQFLFPGAFMPLPDDIRSATRTPGFEETSIPAADGTGLFTIHHAPQPGRPVVVVFHGNGSYPEDYGFLYEGWAQAGYGIVASAARGYPRSAGEPDGEAMLKDALDIHDWATRTYPGHPVVVFGQSLGTALAVRVASKRDVASAVLISPFTSMLSLVREKMPWLPTALLLRSPFRSDLDIAAVKAPILILHGDQDALVPIESGRALAAMANSKVTFVTVAGAGHNQDLFGADMIERIARFVEATAPASP